MGIALRIICVYEIHVSMTGRYAENPDENDLVPGMLHLKHTAKDIMSWTVECTNAFTDWLSNSSYCFTVPSSFVLSSSMLPMFMPR